MEVVKWNFMVKPHFQYMEEFEIVLNTVDLIKEGLSHIFDDPYGQNIYFASHQDIGLDYLEKAYAEYLEGRDIYEGGGYRFEFYRREEKSE